MNYGKRYTWVHRKLFFIQNAGCSISFLLCRDSYSYSITSDAIYPFITLATISLHNHLSDFRLKVGENKNMRNVLDRVFFIQSKNLTKWLTCEVWQNQDLYTRKNAVNTVLDKYHLSVSVLNIDDDFTLIWQIKIVCQQTEVKVLQFNLVNTWKAFRCCP